MKTNEKLKKFIGALIVLVFIAILVVIVYELQANGERKIPTDIVKNINLERSQVMLTGEGYSINKKQDETYKEEKKQHEENLDKKEETQKNNVSQNSGVSKPIINQGESGSGGMEIGIPKEDVPTIETDLKQGETAGGNFKSFYVKATDYKGCYISSYNLNVTVNNEKITSTGDNNNKVTYRGEINDGENTIAITATDKYGNYKTVTYTIYGDSNVKPEVAGKIIFSVEASTLGLGCLIGPIEVEFYKGEQTSYIFDRVLKNHGYGYSKTGSLTNGFYLARINKLGITNGWTIPQDLLLNIEDSGYTELPHREDSLGEKDYSQGSGWMLQVNGLYPESGFSSLFPTDGDELRIRYTLWYGKDIGGNSKWSGGTDWGKEW